MKTFFVRSGVLYLLLLLSYNYSVAQTLSLRDIPTDKKQFEISFNKVLYSNNYTSSTLSGVYQFSLNIPVSAALNFVSDIPYIHTSFETDYGFYNYSYKESGFGNIFIGLQTNSNFGENKRSIFSFGLFLPTADEKAAYSGLYSDYYYMQKFVTNSVGIYFNYAYHKISGTGLSYGFELGPNVFIPTKNEHSEIEVLMHYGAIGGYQINKLLLNIEFLGTFIVTQDMVDFEDRFVHLLNFGVQWKDTGITPKIFYTIYLKDGFRDSIDGVLSIGVNFSIN
jgi:hypothetical protein